MLRKSSLQKVKKLAFVVAFCGLVGVFNAQTASGGQDAPASPHGQENERNEATFDDGYLPLIPLGETRSTWTALAVTPSPFALSAGQAHASADGEIILHASWISDERYLWDDRGRDWRSDGEVRVFAAEYVSPRLGRSSLPFHVSGSLHAYTLNDALFDGVRNWFERNVFGGQSDFVRAIHMTGGRELVVQTPNIPSEALLGSSPLFKLRFGGKLVLPTTVSNRLSSAVSLGFTLPSFGSNRGSGNSSFAPDATIAYRFLLFRWWHFAGATSISFPGGSRRYEELGLEHASVLASSTLNMEFVTRRFRALFGATYNSPYVENLSLPMTEASFYINVGFAFRVTPRLSLFLSISENPAYDISGHYPDETDGVPEQDYRGLQKDADFNVLAGWHYRL